MRVVFFGTPEFAVPSLEALLGEGFDVLAAVTQPDRPRGRSRSTPEPPPVKVAAEEEDVPVLQPERPTDPTFVARLRALAPDVGVVVAYGHILKPDLLAIPRQGMVNVHPSLLPELRGAAPIEWAIINGLEKTGVTIMQLDAGMDSGPILHQIPEDLPADITGGELSLHLAEVGAEALVEALARLAQGAIQPRPQDHARATYAPKVTRETARIGCPARSGCAGVACRPAAGFGEAAAPLPARGHRRTDRPPAGPQRRRRRARGRRRGGHRIPRPGTRPLGARAL